MPPRNNLLGNPNNNQGKKNNQPKSPDAGSFVAKFRGEFSNLKVSIDVKKNAAVDKLLSAIKEGKRDEAEGLFSKEIRVCIDDLKAFLDGFPNEFDIEAKLSGKDKTKEIADLAKIKEEVSKYITRLQDDYGLSFKDRMKDAEKRSPEEIDKSNRNKLGESLDVLQDSNKRLLDIYGRIEERKKTGKKLSDEEKLRYSTEIDVLRMRISTTYSEYLALKDLKDDFKLNTDRDKVQEKLVYIIEALVKDMANEADPASSLVSKITAALEKPVDETKEKFTKFTEEMDVIQRSLSQIQKDIEDARKGSDKKIDKDDRPAFEMRIEQELSKITQINIEFGDTWNKLTGDLFEQSKSPSDKQTEQRNALLKRFKYLEVLGAKLNEKVGEGMSLKDQRENVKGIAGRVTDIEKMMKDEYDKLDIGKKYEDGQRATYTLMLDSEIISARDAREELEALPDTPENQPTRATLEKQLDDIDKRIKKLEEKVNKERVAKEKEVKEKLDAAEAEIEKMEDKIREEKAKEAAGKMMVAENMKPESQEKMGILNKLWSPFVKYKNGLTYHDQKNVNDSLKDPADDIKKAKEWIEKMPEDTEKDLKLKKRLMKKAKRINARRRSVMFRHFFMLKNSEKGKLIGNAAFEGAYNKVTDAILG